MPRRTDGKALSLPSWVVATVVLTVPVILVVDVIGFATGGYQPLGNDEIGAGADILGWVFISAIVSAVLLASIDGIRGRRRH